MGKGGGALSSWLREFTALVFTQTIQAFIYAIIISIILFGMVNVNEEISASDQNSALGLMATFALLSVFKVEELTKKIFGIGDTKASHKNAMKSIAKTAIAAKLGSRVLNNAGKVLGGIKATNKAGQDRRKQKARLEEDMKDNGFEMQNGKAVYVGKGRSSSSGSTSSTASSNGSGVRTIESGSDGFGGGAVDVSVPNVSIPAVNTDVISDSAKRRMKNALRSYEDKLDEINKARNEGLKSIASGLTEFAASVPGAAMGGLLGGADGDIDEMLQGIMAGAGVGDTIGKNTIEGIDRAINFAKRNYKRQKGVSSNELKKTISSYKSAIEDINVKYGVNDVSDI